MRRSGLARRSWQRIARLGAAAVAALALAFPAAASDVAVSACQCLLRPGDAAAVSVQYTNSTGSPAQLVVELTLPNAKKLYLSPVGLVERTVPWFSVPAGTTNASADVIDQVLTAQSLPFGNWPLVPPFRYAVSAMLVDAATGAPLAPFAASWFDFEPFEPSPPPTEPGTLHVFAHQHGDPAWLLRESDAFPAMADWIAQSIALAQSDPSYRFVIDQPIVGQAFEQLRPDLKTALQQLVDAGRVEFAGGFYVLSDLNLLSGESLARQIVYGQRYLESRWGRRARIAWNLDQFGHPHQMPQLAAKGGMPYYAFTRGIPKLSSLGLPGSEFYWRAPDGSRVLANNVGNGYQLGRSLGDVSPDDQELTEIFLRVQPSARSGHFLTGAGADVSEQVLNGYTLNVHLPDAIAHWNASQAPGVSARISTPSEFFAAVEASNVSLPTIGPIEFQTDGEEDDPRIFPASYASHMEVKQANERLEGLLLDTEKLSTIAWIEGASYPAAEIEARGLDIARNQTHDYLPGTGVDAIYADPDSDPNDFGDRAAQAEAALLGLREDAIDHLVARIDTEAPGGATPQKTWVVFNTMAWERTDLVRIALVPAEITQPAKLVDDAGRELAYQILQHADGSFELVFVATLPATGWATFHLVDGAPAQSPEEIPSGLSGGLSVGLGSQFRMNFDQHGFVRGLFSNATNEPLIQRPAETPGIEDLGGLLWWADDLYGNSYDYGPPLATGSQAGRPSTTYAVAGPVMTRVISVGDVASTSLAVREVAAIPALGRIEFDTTLFWTDVNKNLYVRFPFEAKTGASITNGVPYGYTVRGAGHQPVLGWATWGTSRLGVSVLNRALFDHDFSRVPGAIGEDGGDPQLLDVTLLHSISRAVFGDFASESMKQQGVHKYRYALVPHHGTWREAQTPRRAHEFGAPPIAVEAPAQAGTLPPRRSYLALNPASDAIVTVFQRDGSDVVARLYDTTGRVASHTLSFPFLDATTVDKTDLLGGFLDSLGAGSTVEVPTAPEEIATLRLNAPEPTTPPTPSGGTAFSRAIDLATANVPRITGASAADLSGRAVSAIGDIDGDGYADLLVGANQGDGPNDEGASGAGEVAVVFGGPRSRFGSGFSLAQADMTLYGLRPNSFAGTRVTAGDLDCDGFSDLVIGSVGNPTGEESRNASGVTWVVFGGPRETLAKHVDLASQADLEIWGQPGDIAGSHVTVADLDGNGCADVVIGAPSGDGLGDAVESAGEAYVLFGGPRAQVVQSGIRVLGIHHDTVIYGAQVFDHFGWAIEPGDFDADGYDDLAISAIDADGVGNAKQAAGDIYLFWGGPQETLLGQAFAAATLDNMSVFYGIDTGDLAGFNFGTGDVDADGHDDLLVGLPYSDGKGNAVGDVTGEAVLWFGRPRGEIATTNTLAAEADVIFYGALPDDATGHTVIISDLNDDGFGDLVIGAPVANGFQGQRPESGSVHVLLGRPRDEWPVDLVLGGQTANYVIRGSKSFESAGFGLSAGDLDGDGRPDLVIGAPFYSGTGPGSERVGASYVLFADAFTLETKDVITVERAEWNPDTGMLRIDARTSAGGAAYRTEAEVFVREGGVTTQLTEDALDATRLFSAGGALVWERDDGGDPEIFFWNGGSVLQLTDDAATQSFPRTDGTGVVWTGVVGGDPEVFYWNGTSVAQLTDNTTDDLFPDVSNGRVVWMGFDGEDFEIFLWENGVTTQLTDDALRDQDPRIDGDDVVWSSFDGTDYEIERFDGVATTALTDDAFDDVLPQVEAGQVAWQKRSGDDLDVYLWDGAQLRTLADDALADAGVVLSQGRVAWSKGSGDAAEIFLYDPGATPTIQQITSDAAADVAPALDGAALVWEKRAPGGAGDSEIWSFDGAVASALTDDDLDQRTPVASGGRIAWLGTTVDATLRVAGIGDLGYDPLTGLYSGAFALGVPPPSLTIESPLGGAATVEVASLPGVSPEVVVEPITDDGGDLSDRDPQIWGSRVAWSGFDGNDYEIYLWDGTSVTQITDDATDDLRPRLHDGKLVWERFDGGDHEILYWDGSRTRQLTNNAVEDSLSSLHAGEVVWVEGSGDAREIVLYRAGTRTRVTRNAVADTAPAVERGVVVWQGFDGNDWEIFRWQRGRVTQLTDNDFDDVSPLLSGGAVVWLAQDGPDREVRHWADGVTTPITDDAFDVDSLVFRDGVAAWRQIDGASAQIWSWSGGALRRLSGAGSEPASAPSTDQGIVTWQGGAGPPEIFVASATTGDVTRLTSDAIPDQKPQVQGGRVVWQAPNGAASNLDVYLFDGAAIRNLSAAGDATSNQKPTIGAGGRIAWQGFDGDPEIEVKDPGGARVQLTQNRFEEFAPHVDPVTGWVIWHGLDDVRQRVDNPGQGEGGTGATVVGGDFEVFLWNGAAVQRLTTRDKLDDFYPWIHDGKAVWLGGDGNDVEVFFWNGTTTVQLTNNAFDESNARTWGGRAVWQGWDGNDMEIFYWPGSGPVQQLTNNQTNDVSPEIWGDQIVWSAFDGNDFEIVLHDVVAGASTQLTANPGDDVGAQIADGLVVWQGFDGQDFEIFRWDTYVVTQLTHDSLRDERPRLDPLGRIVWQKSDGFDLEIWYRAGGANHRVTDNLNDDLNPEIFDGTIVWQAFDGRDFEIQRMQIP